MDSNGIDALLVALKRKESGQDDTSTDMPDMPDDSDDGDTNSKIVDALKTEYPEIYAKLIKEVGGSDSSPDDSSSLSLDDVS